MAKETIETKMKRILNNAGEEKFCKMFKVGRWSVAYDGHRFFCIADREINLPVSDEKCPDVFGLWEKEMKEELVETFVPSVKEIKDGIKKAKIDAGLSTRSFTRVLCNVDKDMYVNAKYLAEIVDLFDKEDNVKVYMHKRHTRIRPLLFKSENKIAVLLPVNTYATFKGYKVFE